MDKPSLLLSLRTLVLVLIFVVVYRVVIVCIRWGFVCWCLLVRWAFVGRKTLSRSFEAPFWWRHWDPESSFANCILSQRWLGRSATSRKLKGKSKKSQGRAADGRKRGRPYSDISRSSTRDPCRGLRSTAAVMRSLARPRKQKRLGSWHSRRKLHHAVHILPF